MLAHPYDKYKHKLEFPCFVQPKLDGIRAVYNDKKLFSRNNKEFLSVNHISSTLEEIIPDNIVLDGELYISSADYPEDSDVLFEELVSTIKKSVNIDNEKSKLVKYYVYDIYDKNNPKLIFKERNEIIKKIFEDNINNNDFIKNIKYVETFIIDNEKEILEYHKKFLSSNYEGTMLRNSNGIYSKKHRSHDLQKYKDFLTEEFEIVNFKDGKGKDEGLVTFLCKTENGDIFAVKPNGTDEYRRDLYNNGKEQIGKLLIVKYQQISKKGVPRFGIGKTIRDYE